MAVKLIEAISEMRESEAVALTREMLQRGADPQGILDDCRAAMEIVGKRFEAGKYFLPELILAGEILKEISALIKPLLLQEGVEGKRLGRVVLGMVGGGTVDDHVRVYSGADGFGSDATAAVSLARQWVGGN